MPKSAKTKREKHTFYDRIPEIHNFILRLSRYRVSVAKLIKKIDLRLDENSYVLDAGSGTGEISLGFQKTGIKVKHLVAVDLSFNSLLLSREVFDRFGVQNAPVGLLNSNVLSLPFPDASFDFLMTCGVLEYVPLRAGLAEFARVLKPGARIILIPIKPSPFGTVLKFLYSFEIHPPEEIQQAAAEWFDVEESRKFRFDEPIGWSKMAFILRRK